MPWPFLIPGVITYLAAKEGTLRHSGHLLPSWGQTVSLPHSFWPQESGPGPRRVAQAPVVATANHVSPLQSPRGGYIPSLSCFLWCCYSLFLAFPSPLLFLVLGPWVVHPPAVSTGVLLNSSERSPRPAHRSSFYVNPLRQVGSEHLKDTISVITLCFLKGFWKKGLPVRPAVQVHVTTWQHWAAPAPKLVGKKKFQAAVSYPTTRFNLRCKQ